MAESQAHAVPQTTDLRRRVRLGRTGLEVSRLGIGSSYGVGADAIQRAYEEYGINYLYWGSLRRARFGRGIRRVAEKHRDDLVVVLQSYSRMAGLMRVSVRRALGKLGLDYADVLIFGLFNRLPAARLIDAGRQLRDEGLVRFLGVSCHNRPTFVEYLKQDVFDIFMFRYNAVHRGAEREIFPHLPEADRPGTVVYTATRWGHLPDPQRTPPGEETPRASDCYRFVLSHPKVDVCITGPADTDQLREALAALDRGPMDPDELAWMRRVGDGIYRQPLRSGLRGRLWRIGDKTMSAGTAARR
ncbi:MAG: hypothetical protein ACOC46_03995 [Pirellulales bacterium]